MQGRRVLLGVTGGIAAYKAAYLARLLVIEGAEVTTIMTSSASRFVGPDTFAGLTGRPSHVSLWERPGQVLHVELARGSDAAVVAPATANTLAKLARGIADDLLTSTLLEFSGPLVVAPAMHTGMWEHPATRENVRVLIERGAVIVGPVAGPLAHGDEGLGRMAEPEEIAGAVAGALGGDLDGRTIVVTAGPTHEAIDPVRFIGNRSSGKMGMAVAERARARGARVRLIVGPGTVPPPDRMDVVEVTTAEEMRVAVLEALDGADVLVMAAAVADFRPKAPGAKKLKKDDGTPALSLEPTPDILGGLQEDRRSNLVTVGFAAETEQVVEAGQEKLRRKGVDLLVANEVGRPGTGFGSDTNRAAILVPDQPDVELREWTKFGLADALLDRVAAVLAGVGHDD